MAHLLSAKFSENPLSSFFLHNPASKQTKTIRFRIDVVQNLRAFRLLLVIAQRISQVKKKFRRDLFQIGNRATRSLPRA